MGVRYYSTDQLGSVNLTGQAGSFIALLDQLATGWGTLTATSCTVASNIATITLPSAHAFIQYSSVLISGSSASSLNTEKKVISNLSGNRITVSAPGIADGTITGTISVKVAPAGFTKVYSGTNLAAYQFQSSSSTKSFFRINDTGTYCATIRGYESMSDIDNGFNKIPTTFDANFLRKSITNNNVVRPWRVFVDDQGLYFSRSLNSSNYFWTNYIGDLYSYKPNDPYCFTINGDNSDLTTSVFATAGDVACGAFTADTTANASIIRDSNGLVNGIYGRNCCIANRWTGNVNTINSASGAMSGSNVYNAYGNASVVTLNIAESFPSVVDNKLKLFRNEILEHPSVNRRGYYPGLFHTSQYVSLSLNAFSITEVSIKGVMKPLAIIPCAGNNLANLGAIFIEMDDWRT